MSLLRCLDVVFVIDSTGSMEPYIEEVKEKVILIMKEIERAEIGPLVNFGIVVYGDHPPEDTIITKSFELTGDHDAVLRNVRSLPRTGGGDYPEAVVDGLKEGIDMRWRDGSHRVLVLIGDAPPHGYATCYNNDYGADFEADYDAFPSGCPVGLDPFQEAERAKEMGIIIYSVGVNAQPDVVESFRGIAKTTGGEYLSLEHAGRLTDLILQLLKTEVVKMETDMKTYTIVQKTKVLDPEYIGSTLGLSRHQAEESLTRLRQKGVLPPTDVSNIHPRCNNCGLTNFPSAKFCRHCGKPLR